MMMTIMTDGDDGGGSDTAMMPMQIYDVWQLKLHWFSFLSSWKRLKLIKLILLILSVILRVSMRMMMKIFRGHAG